MRLPISASTPCGACPCPTAVDTILESANLVPFIVAPDSLGQLLDLSFPRLRREQISLVKNNQHVLRRRNLPYYQALGGLCLEPLGRIYYQEHDVDDLGSADDCADEGGVAWAVDESELQLVVRKVGQCLRDIHLRRANIIGRGRGLKK